MSAVFDELTSLTGFPSRLISIDDFTLGVFFSVIFLHISLFQLGSSFQVSGSLQSLTSAFGPPGKYVLGNRHITLISVLLCTVSSHPDLGGLS